MNLLASLGLSAAEGPLMLIAPPDSVLQEAGRMKPRPSIASTLQVAEPTARIVWWPEQRHLTPATLSRFAWMLSAADGMGWLIAESDGDVTEADIRAAL